MSFNNTHVRRPTRQEKKDLLNYYITVMSLPKEQIRDYRDMINELHIAVFDKYVTSSPDYAGRSMIVLSGQCPGDVRVFSWRPRRPDGKRQPPLADIDNHTGELYNEGLWDEDDPGYADGKKCV